MIRAESFAATTDAFAAKRKKTLEDYDQSLYAHVADALKRVGLRSWENPLVEMATKLFTDLARSEVEEWTPQMDILRDDFERELRATLQKATPVPQERFLAQVDRTTRWMSTMIVNAATEAATTTDPDPNVGLEWVTMEDDKVRESHQNASGQQIPTGGKFKVGDVEMLYPGEPVGDPENWINCRCVVRPAMLNESLTAAANNGNGVTSTVIVALPAADDPASAVSSEEAGAHCTLLFLGDSANLDGEALKVAVQEFIDRGEVGVITDKVSGTATLGEDSADVVLLDATNLSALRSGLLEQEFLAEAYLAVEQFPTWIPHVTLGYPDAPANGEFSGEAITFDRLAVWNGEERTEFQLGAQPKERVEEVTEPVIEEKAAVKLDAFAVTVKPPVETEDDPPVEEEDDAPQIPDDLADIEVPWHGVLAPEGIPSGDGRMFANGALTWRDLPLSLKAMFVDDEQHKGSVVAGRIDRIWRENGEMRASGVFDANPAGYESIRMLAEGMWRGVSVDVDSAELSMEETEANPEVMTFGKARISAATLCVIPAFAEAWISLGPWPEEEKLPDVRENPDLDEKVKANLIEQYGDTELGKFKPVPPQTKDGPGWITHPDPTEDITNYWVDGRGALKIKWGAGGDFNRCRRQLAKYVQNPDWLAGLCANLHYRALGIWPGEHKASGEAVTMKPDEGAELASVNLVASAASDTVSIDYFRNPMLEELTALQVTPEGRVFGHVAAWDECHVGRTPCVTPPHSATDYGYFLTGMMLTDAGPIPVGQISLGGGHADGELGMRAAAIHYDSTSSAVADVYCGEDEFGIWVSGMVREGVTAKQVRELRASAVSGDWRGVMVSGAPAMELMAVLAVNVPGFPIRRARANMHGEQQVSLVAAGMVQPDPMSAERLARVEKIQAAARARRVEKLNIRINSWKGGK